VRHVADRMPDRGKRGKDIAILQMGQDAYRKISEIRNCYRSIEVAAPVDTTATPAFKPAVPGRFAE